MSGFDLHLKLQQLPAFRQLCFPYLFYSTCESRETAIRAYEQGAQGFFVKPNSLSGLQEMLSIIIDYWRSCCMPGAFGR